MNPRYLLSIVVFFYFANASFAQQGELVARGHRRTTGTEDAKSSIYSVSQFIGRWQEVKRTNAGKKNIAFTDTTLLHFNDDKTVETRNTADDKMTMHMVEKATIDEDNSLSTGAEDYTIVSVSKDAMALQGEDEVVHYFKRSGVFAYELAEKYVPAKNNTTPEPELGKISLTKIMGHWTVYKRQAKPGFVTPALTVIKYLELTQKVDKNTASGMVTIYKSTVSEQVPCTVTIDGTNIKIVTSEVSFDLPVAVADGQEFDFGTTDLMYFCKQL
ncbi:MAG TPA: hypothetical protein VK718_08415 [Ferruginibacter sp.]|nr:hypothetical protein [Ferruginibacter sp.]